VEGNTQGFLIDQLMPKLEKYCAFQERCVFDVKAKLTKMNVEREHWNALLERLEQDGFLNEERYTELFIRSKVRQKGWGPVKIRMELRRKNIDASLIEKYASLFQAEDQEELLNKWLSKKYKTITGDEPAKQREKLIRFGISKGFGTGMVFAAVNKIIKAQPDD